MINHVLSGSSVQAEAPDEPSLYHLRCRDIPYEDAQQRYPEARLLDVELDAQTNQLDAARSKLASLMQDSAVLPAWINDATKAWKDKINP